MRKNNGFTLAEMMVILLIVSIIMAAAAPIISKRATLESTEDSNSFPAGAVITWAGTNAPSGRWLLCDGTGYSPTDSKYRNLFKAIGYQYGNSWGKFLVPDLIGRTPVGQDSGKVRTQNLTGQNNQGGEETHTIAKSELPNESVNVNSNANTNVDLPTTTNFNGVNSAYAYYTGPPISGRTEVGITTGQSTSTTPVINSNLYGITTSDFTNNASGATVSNGAMYCTYMNSYGGCERTEVRGYSMHKLSSSSGASSSTSTTNIINTHVHHFSFTLPTFALWGTAYGKASGNISGNAQGWTDQLGSGQSFSHMQPYLVVNYYIKY